MQIRNQIGIIGLLILIFNMFPFSGQSQNKSGDDKNNVCIPGTNVCLFKPSSYILANKFPGIKNPESGAFVMISELENSLPVIYKSFTSEKFREQEMELIDKRWIDFGDYQGALFKVSKVSGNIFFGKWILILENDSLAIMINGTFPDKFDSDVSKEIENSVLSAYINADKLVNAENSVGYRIDVEGTKLKFAKSFPGILVYTVGGVFPLNSHDPITFKVGSSLGKVNIAEPKEFAIEQIKSLPYDFEEEMELNPIVINDLSGYEITTYGKERVSGKRQILYQVILFDKESYFVMLGTAYNDYENNLSLFIDVSSSFMREIRY